MQTDADNHSGRNEVTVDKRFPTSCQQGRMESLRVGSELWNTYFNHTECLSVSRQPTGLLTGMSLTNPFPDALA